MTLTGAIKELHELRSAEDMPIYYKPIIAEVINVLLMDTQEVKHGRWIGINKNKYNDDEATCSICGATIASDYSNPSWWDYCPNCGSKME